MIDWFTNGWEKLNNGEISALGLYRGVASKPYILKQLLDEKWKFNNLVSISVVELDTNKKPCNNWTKRTKRFSIPEDIDGFISAMFDLALTHNIIAIRTDFWDIFKDNLIYVSLSTDGNTNIDTDVMEGFIKCMTEGQPKT